MTSARVPNLHKPKAGSAGRRETDPAPSGKPPAAKPDHARPRHRPNAAAAGQSWLWGRHAVLAALANPRRKSLRLVATAEHEAELAALAADLPPEIIDKGELQRLLPQGAVHQGLALAVVALPSPDLEDVLETLATQPSAILLALDQVTDPHNIGAVLRSAAAFGAAGLIVPDRNVPEISGTLAKAASGAVEHVPLVRVVNLNRALDRAKAAGFWTVGLDGEAAETLAEQRLTGRICLVLGAEGDGLRRLTREACDLMARLPTAGAVASLNVSNAAAIALYETVRQRG